MVNAHSEGVTVGKGLFGTEPEEPGTMAEQLNISSTEAVEYFFDRGWTDGLPIVPPTPDLVEKLLGVVDLAPDAVLGSVPERDRHLTAEKAAIAVNRAFVSEVRDDMRRTLCEADARGEMPFPPIDNTRPLFFSEEWLKGGKGRRDALNLDA